MGGQFWLGSQSPQTLLVEPRHPPLQMVVMAQSEPQPPVSAGCAAASSGCKNTSERSGGSTCALPPCLPPEPLEPAPRNAGVMGRVLGISVAEVILHGAQIRALVGEIIAAGMAQHVGPDAAELRFLAGQAHDVIDGLAGQ